MIRYPDDIEIKQFEKPREIEIGDNIPAVVDIIPAQKCECDNCQDIGFVYYRTVVGTGAIKHWIGDREIRAHLLATPCPVCQGGEQLLWLQDQSGLHGKTLDAQPMLEIHVIGLQPQFGQEEAFNLAWKILSEIPDLETWFLVTGGYGRGKTHILIGMINDCIRARIHAHYTRSEEILKKLRSSYDKKSVRTVDDVRGYYESIPVLAIDELDRVKWTQWAGEQMFGLIENRYTHGRATWFASNSTVAEMETVETLAAVISRIGSGYAVALTGPDLRSPDKEYRDYTT